ncbi:MAG TPA: type II toxin-antitoxin system VapC family toxin [Terriglobales bacterium]|nr:type II toxin-antitoxin system VapC family toxin [Terriglobales bacterium]
MKLLLDTHIWLWSFRDPARLTRRVIRELQKPENELWLSSISIWEFLILCEKGRIILKKEDPHELVARMMDVSPLLEAPITHEVALETSRIQPGHKDPRDRLLLATARVFDLTLVTADERLLTAPNIRVLANR